MHITHTVRPVLIASAVVTTIFAAPMATAAPAPLNACGVTGATSRCQSPGNTEMTSPLRVIDYYHYGTIPFPLGGR
jgi:hypothetical protein